MEILVQQIKTALEGFVISLEGSENEKKTKWRAAMRSIPQSVKAYENDYPDRTKDIDIFDTAWTKCDLTYEDLAKRFKTSEGAIKQSLFRIRKHILKGIESLR
jgi:hypothetical protein